MKHLKKIQLYNNVFIKTNKHLIKLYKNKKHKAKKKVTL